VDECIQFAVNSQVAFLAEQILQTTYHAMSTSGYYTDACKEWRKKAAVGKTWTTFKTFFAAEYHDMKEQQKMNHSQNNFHGANAVTDISTALDNLALEPPPLATLYINSPRAINNSPKRTNSSLNNFTHPSKPTMSSSRKWAAQKQSPAPAPATSGRRPPFDRQA
jgi:hypothetical protein